MNITDENIREAISALNSATQVDMNKSIAWVHPRQYFRLQNFELCLEADKLNEKIDKDIWDKRTKGYKLIKPYLNF